MILHYLQSGVSPPILPNLLTLQYDIFDGTLDLKKLEKIYDSDVGIKMDEKKLRTQDEFFIEEVYDRITTAKNLTKRKLRFIKTTFLDAYLGHYDSPNFEKIFHADRTFLEMAD
uniref:Uncharacterized protein n=1 Tax=Panagrolaimus davidi TaxID=227884 RepID=A0A914Q3E6_9BILA